ncbi:MAG TPA: tripartite tricarboxylate transporter substrate binding protein [Ramlibacter sp.]|nr:tripartite tricarboxylate transporter substrate binding protein [Ramlibacter sp.]
MKIATLGKTLFTMTLAASCSLASAQKYPNAPVTLIMPFQAGSSSDVVGRYLVDELRTSLGGTWVVDNKPGANSSVGAAASLRAAPNGYTLYWSTSSSHSINPSLYKSLPYDPIADFVQVARVVTFPWALVVSKDVPATDIKQFIDYAKARPGQLNYGHGNAVGQVAAASFSTMAGMKATGISYKGAPQALVDLLAGRLQFMFTDFSIVAPHLNGDRLRVLGVSTPTRTELMPGVLPISDTALPGFQIIVWAGIAAPRGTPPEITALLAKEVDRLLNTPRVRQKILSIGAQPAPLIGPEFDKFVREQKDYWALRVKEAGISPE